MDIVFPLEFKELLRLKKEIDKNPEKWEEVKRVINPLEFASSDIAVAKVQPISRAFFKMIELTDKLNPLPENPVRTLHLAESPGGFVQAWNWIRKPFGFTDDITSISLEKGSYESTWKRLIEVSRFWSSRPHLYTGDLLNKDTRSKIINEYREGEGGARDGGEGWDKDKGKAWLVTGDGGFDFSEDYQNQETAALPLILAQMLVGLRCLEKGGAMILKVFDCFTLPTIQILWVFCKVFGEFRIVKPDTSRVCNAEKYIIAKDFKGVDNNLDKFLLKIDTILNTYYCPLSDPTPTGHTISTLFETGPISKWDTMDESFKMCFETSIRRFINTQITWIQRGIDMMNTNTIREDTLKKTKYLVRWCRKYHIPINREYFESHRLCLSSQASPLESEHLNHRVFFQRPEPRSDLPERAPLAFQHRRRSCDET
jgi:23S rRNA U2552 (ribose-2'-O)-methylase RlmE/FtsJ